MILTYNAGGVPSSEDYLYGQPLEWKVENITNILKEKLKDLDQLREDILATGNNRFELTRNSKLGGSIDFGYVQHILRGNNSKYENSTVYNRNSAQCGFIDSIKKTSDISRTPMGDIPTLYIIDY